MTTIIAPIARVSITTSTTQHSRRPINSFLLLLENARPAEGERDLQHTSIQHIQVHLITHQSPRIPLEILDNPERAPDQDHCNRSKQDDQVLFPRHRGAERCGGADDATPENEDVREEEAEEEDLHAETEFDDQFAGFGGAGTLPGEDGAACEGRGCEYLFSCILGDLGFA